MPRYFIPSVLALTFVACATAPRSQEDRSELREEADQVLQDLRAQSPEIRQVLDQAHGFVVFPSVGRAAAGLGGGYGRGVVYENGQMVGYADVTEGSAGLQLGGQVLTEIIAFENEFAMNRFKTNEFGMDARASAVAIEAGASTAEVFRDGVAVFTFDETGLMVEAALGGQKFSFVPM